MTRRIPLWLINTAAFVVVAAAIMGAQWLTHGGLSGP